jgi:hypothetical protein
MKKLIPIILIAFLSSCSLSTKLVKTGFNRTKTLKVGNYEWFFDPKITYRVSYSGLITEYRTNDPRLEGLLIQLAGNK